MSDRLFEEWRSTGADEQVKYLDWLEERVERVEASLADAQSENEVLRKTISEAWDECAKQIKLKDEQLRDANDDLLFYDDACRYCLMPEVEYAWRHDHDGDGRFHWHHRLDPGDGLVSDCKHSEMYEQIWQEAQVPKDERIRELEQRLAEETHWGNAETYAEFQQQLKAARERLADAERILRDSIDDGYRREWATGYFAKHSPSPSEGREG